MTSVRRHYVAPTSLRRHVPAGNLAPLGPPNILNLGPPNILNLPTPMYAKDWVFVDCGTICCYSAAMHPKGADGKGKQSNRGLHCFFLLQIDMSQYFILWYIISNCMSGF